MNHGKLIIFAGNASTSLAHAVCELLDTPLSPADVSRFRDGEIKVQLLTDVRGKDVFIINSTNPSADNFFELVLLSKAAHGSSAERVTIVIPYLGYNRQERKDRSRVAVAAKVAIDFLKLSLAQRVLLVDLHSEATASLFEPMVVDHLYASYVGVPFLKDRLPQPFVVASPDAGGVARVRKYAQHFNTNFVIFSKERDQPGSVAEDPITIIGDVAGKNVLFIDDMIDSGSTMIADAKAARAAGAEKIYVFATHGIFSRGTEVFADSPVAEIFVTDTISHDPQSFGGLSVPITICSVAPLIAKAIRRIHSEESLSELILR